MNEIFHRQANLIAGIWCQADSNAHKTVTNPATGDVIGTVPNCGPQETRRAIDAAHKTFQTYRHTTAGERAGMLRRLVEAIMDHQEDLAQLLTMEQGKPLAEARGEVAIGASYVQWFAEEARRVYGDIVPSPWGDRRLLVSKQPIGVVAAITPWNFPSSMIARKIGPALAVGCTAVFKPAIQTPYSGLAWGVLCEMAGFPKGAVNIVTGDASPIGKEFSSNEKVRKLTFTGSTKIGQLLIRQSADNVQKLSMELGGNAPFIVFDDADIDKAVTAGMAAKFRNSGQTCVCTNRFYVQDKVFDQFLEKLVKASNDLVVGDGTAKDTTQGPLIDEAAVIKVESILADAKAKGGRIMCGGERHALGSTFFQPTVIADATEEMQCASDEIFGPLAPVFRFHEDEEVIARANATPYGLAAYFCTRDLGRAFRVSEALEYGLVGVNEGIITSEVAPFGGLKHSGLGKEGGKQGVEEYLETKYTCIGGLAD
ncbi:MAG: NAD-dependent succinate-semialdehyde dehydrogenase [Pseudomonadota bacterium]